MTTPVRVAVVGSGPAGIYASDLLVKSDLDVQIDLFEKMPTPFGLIRYGVAPDHPRIKGIVQSLHNVMEKEEIRFLGNIEVGKDITVEEMREYYDAIIFATGATADKEMGIPGEDLPGSIASVDFVGWYNGIPADRDLDVQLDSDTETAVIIGQGNVALDCARILLLSRECLKRTDITRHAYRRLADSRVRRVIIIGRRGPMQAAYKIKEFRELTKMEDCRLRIELSGQQEREALSFSDELLVRIF